MVFASGVCSPGSTCYWRPFGSEWPRRLGVCSSGERDRRGAPPSVPQPLHEPLARERRAADRGRRKGLLDEPPHHDREVVSRLSRRARRQGERASSSAGCATRGIRAGRRCRRCCGASAGDGASAGVRLRISIRGRGFRASTAAQWRPGCAAIWCGLASMDGAASSFRAGARRSTASSCASRSAAGRPARAAARGAPRTTRRRRSRVERSTCLTTPGSGR
jgi:hypothetical protein